MKAQLLEWKCHSQESESVKTVGDVFFVSCYGNKQALSRSQISIQALDKKDKYKVHFLKLHSFQPNSIDMTVTSYIVGEHQPHFYITDGHKKILVKNLKLNIKSVLGKQPNNASPFGPWLMDIPVFWQFLFWSILGFFVIQTARFFYRIISRKMFLKHQKITKESYREFIKKIRKQQDDPSQFLQTLKHGFFKYLQSKLLVPTQNKSDSSIMNSIKKYQAQIYKHHSKTLEQILSEFSYFQDKKITEHQVQKLKKLVLELVFKIEEDQIGKS